MIKQQVKRLIPAPWIPNIRKFRHSFTDLKWSLYPDLTEERFLKVLSEDLGVKRGDVVFVHSSINGLHTDFPFFRVLHLLKKQVGKGGTLLFPTYPQLGSNEFLKRGEIFNVSKSPSYTGIITEFARKQKEAKRSLHPTKSVCAIGAFAHELVSTHQDSPYPYDATSPYFKIIDYDGKIIGLGCSTDYLSFVHCAEDVLKKQFPVEVYVPELYESSCINEQGETQIVPAYAHDLSKMKQNVPKYMKEHVPREVCEDMKVFGREFFRADARALLNRMVALAKQGITIYPSSVNKSTSN
jgi:aminoglycoside 3-N-acetyltransferase